MKKIALFTFACTLLMFSCAENGTETSSIQNTNTSSVAGLELQLQANPEWQHKNLRLYPIYAGNEALQTNAALPPLKTLAEGMHTPGFRITERKQFGRSPNDWYNALTIQNKSCCLQWKSDRRRYFWPARLVSGTVQSPAAWLCR